METKRAVTYCRVSTKEQVDEGNSLNSQEKNCREYCNKNGYEIVRSFVEQGESAKTADRTELQKLLAYCADKKNKIGAVIIYKIDRLSRSTDDYSQLRLLLKRYGVEIKSTSEFFENTPQGRFMENMFANVAQFDNDVRAERCSGGMKDAMREGRYVWMAPIGYDNIRLGGKPNIAPNEQADLIRETFETIAKGTYATEEVRRIMTAKGLFTRKGKPIVKSYFYNMLKNKIYIGYIEKFGESHKGLFTPIISKEVFDQVQRVLKNKGKKMVQYKLNSEDFPLRRFVMRPDGKKLTGSWSRGRNKKYPYYRYEVKGSNYNRDAFEVGFMAFMDSYKLNSELFDKLKTKLSKKLNVAVEGENKGSEKLKSHIKELNNRQNSLIKKNLEGFIGDIILKQQLDLIEKEICDAQGALLSVEKTEVDFGELLDHARGYLENPSKVWREAKLETKVKLQWFQFPQGITFDGVNYGTAQIASIYKTKEAFQPPKFYQVDFNYEIVNQLTIELKYLAWILKGKYDTTGYV